MRRPEPEWWWCWWAWGPRHLEVSLIRLKMTLIGMGTDSSPDFAVSLNHPKQSHHAGTPRRVGLRWSRQKIRRRESNYTRDDPPKAGAAPRRRPPLPAAGEGRQLILPQAWCPPPTPPFSFLPLPQSFGRAQTVKRIKDGCAPPPETPPPPPPHWAFH